VKTFGVKDMVQGSGEYILGAEQTGSHACYMIYGVLAPGEAGREVRPGRGHEELLLAMKGDLQLTGHLDGVLKEGQAVHLRDEETCYVRNSSGSAAVYVIAGGHSGGGHH